MAPGVSQCREDTARAQPILRWAGSKRQLLPVLAPYWSNSYSRYVEPFAGSCSLFYRLRPDYALLADKNVDLMDAYQVLRSSPKALHAAVSSLAADAWVYERVRELRRESLSKFQRAARFIYLNRNCFNGIYRTNLKGDFNVPYATYKQGLLPTLHDFVAASDLLERADLRAWDFGTTLRHCAKGDFVYLDPPFAVTKRRVFRQYGPRTFEIADISRLALHLGKLDRRGIAFVLSYADCKESRTLASDWLHRRVRVRRNIAGFAGARRRSYELLITNIAQSGSARIATI